MSSQKHANMIINRTILSVKGLPAKAEQNILKIWVRTVRLAGDNNKKKNNNNISKNNKKKKNNNNNKKKKNKKNPHQNLPEKSVLQTWNLEQRLN